MTSLLIKTELARRALAPGIRTLSPKERMLVLLADGQRSVQDLLDTVAGATAELLNDLVSRGFLSSAASSMSAGGSPAPAAAAPRSDAAPGQTRSAAAAKLYLLDVSERVFARADPPQWERLRDMLREVRDEAGLRPAIEQVAQAIGRVAGEERAAAVRRELLVS